MNRVRGQSERASNYKVNSITNDPILINISNITFQSKLRLVDCSNDCHSY